MMALMSSARRRIGLRLFAALLLAGALWLAHGWWASAWKPDAARWLGGGVAIGPADVPVNWGRLARDGVAFAYLDATAGSRIAFPAYTAEHDAALAAGIRTGAIHRFDICTMASEQAAAFVRLVPREAPALPPAVLIEAGEGCERRPTRALLLSELTTFLTQVETHLGKPAVIGVADNLEDEYSLTAALNRPLWIRSPRSEPDPALTGWAIWLANDRLSVDGVAGPARWLVANDRTPASGEGQ
jgi:lysozyme